MSMRDIHIGKVVVNIGVGEAGDPLERAGGLLKQITGSSPVQTKSRTRNPTWGVRKGLPIGVKVTLRGEKAGTFLKKAFEAEGNKLSKVSFDGRGNFAFGVKEYIDFPGVKYNPQIGMLGFDVCVSLVRPGYRVSRRKIARSKVGKRHVICDEDARLFVEKEFGVKMIGGWEE